LVSFTLWPLHPQGKNPWYPLDRRLGGPQGRSDAVVKRKIHSPRRESKPRTPIVQPVAQPSSAEVKNACSYTSAPQYVFKAWYLVKYRGTLLCIFKHFIVSFITDLEEETYINVVV
jgi:hypothetical protein